MDKIIAKLYAVMDKGPLRALSSDGITVGGLHFWDPSRFAAKTSELEIWHGLLLMWAVCAGVIHGVGFRPRAIHWQGIFCPLIADLVLLAGLIFFFF
ncbi:cyd operon protein YbgE [Enterobacter sp. EA-1]|nr:cyd operon protein YbgE [Enterobacter sp. EA-1]